MKKLTPVFGWALVLVGACSAGPPGPAWISVSNGLSGAVPSVSQLLIDRATGTTLYSVTSGGLFKSTDSGSSWTALGNIVGVNIIALDPASSTVYAGTAHGVVTSTDGGASWGSAGLSDTFVWNLAVDPVTPSTLYASGYTHLYKSTDRGRNWTDLNLGPLLGDFWIVALVLDPLTPSTLYVAAGSDSSGSVLKSLDGGESWNAIYANAGPFFNYPSSNLVIDPSAPSTLYRVNPFGKSTDGGVSWTPLTGPEKYTGIAGLAVDPRNSNTLYVSGSAIFKSPDGGQSWTAVGTIPAAGSFVFSPDSRTIYATTGSGVFKSVDAGANWAETNTGLRVLSIRMLVGDPVNPATIYAGGDQGLFKSVDSGGNWKSQASPLLAPVAPSGQVAPAAVHSLLIDFSDPNILYLGTDRGDGCFHGDPALYTSADGGATWNDSGISSYLPDGGCEASTGGMVMDPIANTLYLPFGDDWYGSGVLKTTDGGAHWTPATGGLGDASEVNAFVIDPNTPAILYAATDVGVFRSADGGASFIQAGFANVTVVLLAIDPVRSNVLYAATSGLGLYKSTDSGASWSPINQGLDEIVAAHPAVNALLVDPDHTDILYLATSGYGVFRSSDGGATWAAFNNGLNLTSLDVRSLAIVRFPTAPRRGSRPGVLGPNTLYAGTPGGVFKMLQIGN